MDNPVLTDWLTLPGNLASELKEARSQKYPRQQDLADRLGWSASKVSRAERGLTLLSAEDVVRWAESCGVDAGRFAQLREEANRVVRGTAHADVKWTRMFEASTRVVMVENDMIPGPMQTVDYRKALLHELDIRAAGGEERDPPDIRAGLIRERWKTLDDPERQFVFVVTDTVLLRTPASAEAMVEQLERVIQDSERPNVDLHVIADRPGTPIPAFVPFHIYTPADVVHSELIADGWWSTDPVKRLTHHRVLERLISASLAGDEAIDRVRWARDRHAEGWS